MAISAFRFAPRWSIFLIDIACSLVAMLLAFLLRYNFHLEVLAHYELWKIIAITIVVNAAVFYNFKTYTGVIRYTSLEDSGKMLLATGTVCLIFFLVEWVSVKGQDLRQLFPVSVLFIYYFIVNFLLITYRFIIKRTFNFLFYNRKKTTRAVLYNAEHDGLLVHKMIAENPRSDIRIMAFLEDREKLVGKAIGNIPVMRPSHPTFERLKADGVELMILSDLSLNKTRLNELVDMSLAYNIRIQQVPSSRKWLKNALETNQLRNINIEQLLEREVIRISNEKVRKALKGKKILVTGAAGSIGSEIIRQVLQFEPLIVIACDIAETPLHELKLSMQREKKVKYFIGDVCDRVRMEQVFEIFAPDIVYHAAAYKHVPLMEEHPSTAILNNVYGTQTLAELSVLHSVEKFVMVSTDKAVNPTNVMGASKRISEIYIQSYAQFIQNANYNTPRTGTPEQVTTRFVTTRFGNVLGSNGSVIPRFKSQIDEGGPLTITHPEITRYFMTIPEACQLVVEAGVMGKGGEIFVFDMGQPVKILDLAKKMIRLSGKVPDQDIKIEFCGLRPGEKLYEELLNNAENVLPTYHEKIMIAKVRQYDFTSVSTQINELIALAENHFGMETVAKMKEIVPEFVSNNSIFEKLDVKKNPGYQ